MAQASMTTSTIEIAKRERLHDNYVRRLIPLAFLAHTIWHLGAALQRPA